MTLIIMPPVEVRKESVQDGQTSVTRSATQKPPKLECRAKTRLFYSCVPLGIASCTLYEPLCQAAFCCEDVCVYQPPFALISFTVTCNITLQSLLGSKSGYYAQ